MSSLTWTSESRLASFQHGAPAVVLQAPLDWFGPHVSAVCVNNPPRLLASVILVS